MKQPKGTTQKNHYAADVLRDKMARSLKVNLAQTKKAAVRWNRTGGEAELMALANRIMTAIFEDGKEN